MGWAGKILRVDPLDPANKLIFATGPLTATMALIKGG